MTSFVNIQSRLYPFVLALITSVLVVIGLPGYNAFPFSIVALVPLFFALKGKSLWQSVMVVAFSWLVIIVMYSVFTVRTAFQYGGSSSVSGTLIFVAMCLYHAFWFALAGAGYYVLTQKKKLPVWKFIVVTASLWTASEWLYLNIFPSYPWIIILPYTQWNNVPLMQWSSIGSIWLVTFLIVGFNAAMFSAYERKNIKLAVVAVTVFICVHVAGYAMYRNVESETHSSLKAALIQENVSGEARWDNKFVDSLAHILLDLNKQAVTTQPQLIVWSETAIPWTFRTDDDLVNAVLNITRPTGASHVIGMLTDADRQGNVFNSLYYIEPDGKVAARYDKQELLAFLEKPVVSWQLPFRQSRYTNILEGNRSNLLTTNSATLGAMICNETLSPYPAAHAAKDGAQALVAASNDSWFYGSVLTDAHIALTRMRAIETRKDIIVNANRGYCGIIRASGRMETFSPTTTPRCVPVNLQLNDTKTLSAEYPNSVAYLAMVIVCAQGFNLFIQKS